MRHRLNRAFSLVEVLVSLVILSTAIVFVFRSFTTSITAAKLSQDITLATFAAEERIWDIEQRYKNNTSFIIPAWQKFDFNYEISNTDTDLLKKLQFIVSWQEAKSKKRSLEFFTYFLSKEP